MSALALLFSFGCETVVTFGSPTEAGFDGAVDLPEGTDVGRAIAWTQDGSFLGIGYVPRSVGAAAIMRREGNSFVLAATLEGDTTFGRSMTFSAAASTLLVSSGMFVRLYQRSDNNFVLSGELAASDEVRNVSIHPNGTLIAISTGSITNFGRVWVFRNAGSGWGNATPIFVANYGYVGRTHCMCLATDESFSATCSSAARVWSVSSVKSG